MGQMLRSWKEIARHMGASVRTVQRWESEFQLPVRRIEARRGAVVFAFPAELENWLRVRTENQLPLVDDRYFRTVFMDSQFPSLVVNDVPVILAANFAAHDLVGPGEPLLGENLHSILHSGNGVSAAASWAGFLQFGACFGHANLRHADGRMLGIEYVMKRFPPGLHVVSILSAGRQWAERQIWCRPVESDFAFSIRPDGSPNLKPGQRNHAPIDAS
ncbi:MAG TPA: hypothetical protein VJP04_15690 [Terriglobales bacterium]|nr:hypothetical protein [Terriglobales bacterium]